MISGVALAAFSMTAAHAQTAAPAAPADQAAPPATAVQALVVTGSRIPEKNLTSIAPVTTVSNREVQLSGATRVEDLINQLPQVVAEQGAYLANGASGTATVSLRDLGSKRTLVLIDGQRLVPGDPLDPVPDLNFIPAALIDRVEVDTAGASAVYGADAVAGVVNIMMKKNFQGLQLDVNYGFNQNDNNSSGSQAATRAAGFPTPSGNVIDGYTADVSIIFGANSPDDKGNVEAYLDYRHTDPVLQATRDYSACTQALNSARTGFVCRGSETDALGTFIVYGPNFSVPAGAKSAPVYTLDTANPGNLKPFDGTGLFNYGALNYFQRSDERYTGGFFSHYDISPALQTFASFMFMDDNTVAQVAPSGVFGFTYSIPCNDPLLSANELHAVCGQYGLPTGPNSTAVNNSLVLLRRNVEGGDRINELRHTDYRAVIGMKGDIGSGWNYNVYAQYATSLLSESFLNDISKSKLAQSLYAVPGPNGTAVCANLSGGCIPYNIWTPGGVTAAQTDFLSAPGLEEGADTEQVVSGSITGDLGQYGLKSPWASDGIGIALGAEYRRETLANNYDEEYSTGDLAGQGGPKLSVSGSYAVKEVFGEARLPFIEDVPFIKNLSAELGYRYSNYTTIGSTNTYKISGDWAINDDFRIRGGYNRTVRAPNVVELFTPQSVGLDGNSDPCAGPVTPAMPSPAQCANTGVSASQYGHIVANPAAQYNGLTGGNPHLKPETAGTYSLGIVFTPHSLIHGFTASVDYFNTKITNVIQSYGADNILATCAATGDASFCDLIHRAASTGSLWLGTTVVGAPTSGYVTDIVQNSGFIKTSGIDFTADYRFGFRDFGAPDWGSLDINFLGTYTHDYQFYTGIIGSPVLECVGKYGLTCQASSDQGNGNLLSGPLPSWKSKMRVTWSTPWPNLELSVAWRYTGPVSLDTGETGCADCHIEAFNWFDLVGQYRFKNRYTFRVGVNNIFDRNPPIIGTDECPATVCSGNTFPQVYDPLGRYIFFGLTADF